MSATEGVAATFNASKPPPPSTSIGQVRIDSGSGDASFTFKATGQSNGFQCALVQKHTKAKFKGCKSPKKYKKLKPGKYTFEVRAVGPGGPDASPAKTGFKIK